MIHQIWILALILVPDRCAVLFRALILSWVWILSLLTVGVKGGVVNSSGSLLTLGCHASSDVLCLKTKYQGPKVSAGDSKSFQLLLTLHAGSTTTKKSLSATRWVSNWDPSTLRAAWLLLPATRPQSEWDVPAKSNTMKLWIWTLA